MIILALDLAQTTGWALGSVGDAVPRCGSIRFAREGHSQAAYYRGCRTWVDDFVTVNKPDLVVVEAPLPPSFMAGKTNTDTVRVLMGLIAIVEEVLYDRGIRVREATVSKVREFFLGTSRIKREEAKRLTKRRCYALRWAPVDDNAADALALWLYQCSIIDPKIAVRHTPLFGKWAS